MPDDPSALYDMYNIIRQLVDNGEMLEVHANFARNVIVGFARISGMVVGIIANQPMVLAGALDRDASDKVARFIRTCNGLYNIPLVTLVDVPGFLPGVDEERGGIIRHGAKMLHSFASCTTPKITIIVRKAYGGSYLAMCSQRTRRRPGLCLADSRDCSHGRGCSRQDVIPQGLGASRESQSPICRTDATISR